VVLEKDGEDQVDLSCEERSTCLRVVSDESNIVHNTRRKKFNWIGRILRRNCLLKHIIEGKIEGAIKMTGRRIRRCKQLLNGLKERRAY
jgi:hypothetical protein